MHITILMIIIQYSNASEWKVKTGFGNQYIFYKFTFCIYLIVEKWILKKNTISTVYIFL